MNIFYLDEDYELAAKYHCLKHRNKMILESFQMLSTAHRILDVDVDNTFYRIAHKNHPSTKWVRLSKENYKWLYGLARCLSENFYNRTGKHHLSWVKLGELCKTPPKNIPDDIFTAPPQCMPEHCKMVDTVEAYRNYYILEKSRFATWPENEIPYWYKVNV